MINHLLNRCEGRDLGVSDKLIGVERTVSNSDTKLDHVPYAKSIVIEGKGPFDMSKVSTPLASGMDRSRASKN